MSAEISIYTTPYCPYCIRAKRLLQQKGATYSEIDVSDRPDLRSWLVTASGQRTVPQIFINARSYGGFSDIAELDQRGKLEPLLAESPSTPLPSLPT